LKGARFKPSNNEYDWLGPGVYFWEANPERGVEFAQEAAERNGRGVSEPFVVGAVIDLGLCLDLTTASGVDLLRIAYGNLAQNMEAAGGTLPMNSPDGLRRNLDCAVIRQLHAIREAENAAGADTVKGIFTEGGPAYPGAGFDAKTHIQIAVRNLQCVKGIFRVPSERKKGHSSLRRNAPSKSRKLKA